MYDPEIPISMAAVMQQIQRFVSAGFVYYFAGSVPAAKAAQLVFKLDERFDFGATAGQRDAARKRKECSFRLVMYPIPRTTNIGYWVLRSDGGHRFLATEKWLDARSIPITWPFLYELRQMPVPPVLRAKYQRPNGKSAIRPVTWTWRIRREELDRMRWNIRRWVEQRDERLSQLIFGLALAPGFRSIRSDVYGLHVCIRDQCTKRKVCVPELPKLPWVVPRRYTTMSLSVILSRQRRGAAAWFPASKMNRKTADTVAVHDLLETPHAAAKDHEAGAKETGDQPA